MSDNGNQTLQPTSGAIWREPYEKGEIVELPSGNIARLGPANVEILIKTMGDLPDALTGVIANLFFGEGDGDLGLSSLSDLKGYLDLSNALCRACFLEPKVVDNPQKPNEIAPDHIHFMDKVFILERSISEAISLDKFRPQQAGHVETVVDSQPVRAKTK
jgi:hypothetical protein